MIPASLTRAVLHFWPFFSLPKHDQFVARPNLIHGDAAAAAPTPPVVQWQVGNWRPNEEVMNLFESLGRQEWLDLE